MDRFVGVAEFIRAVDQWPQPGDDDSLGTQVLTYQLGRLPFQLSQYVIGFHVCRVS